MNMIRVIRIRVVRSRLVRSRVSLGLNQLRIIGVPAGRRLTRCSLMQDPLSYPQTIRIVRATHKRSSPMLFSPQDTTPRGGRRVDSPPSPHLFVLPRTPLPSS
jgi:hypothetical protein